MAWRKALHRGAVIQLCSRMSGTCVAAYILEALTPSIPECPEAHKANSAMSVLFAGLMACSHQPELLTTIYHGSVSG